MGRPGSRRSHALRVPDPRGRAGGVELVHDSQQARELPAALRRASIPKRVARFTPKQVERLLADPGIVRNRLKIEGAVKNARAFLAVQEERGTFDAYIWGFVAGRPIQGQWRTLRDIPATTPESDALSKDLRRRGFTFVGSTIMLRVHAGGRHGERSHPGLFPAGRGRASGHKRKDGSPLALERRIWRATPAGRVAVSEAVSAG